MDTRHGGDYPAEYVKQLTDETKLLRAEVAALEAELHEKVSWWEEEYGKESGRRIVAERELAEARADLKRDAVTINLLRTQRDAAEQLADDRAKHVRTFYGELVEARRLLERWMREATENYRWQTRQVHHETCAFLDRGGAR